MIYFDGYGRVGVFEKVLLAHNNSLDPLMVLSVGLLTRSGYKIEFHNDEITMNDKNRDELLLYGNQLLENFVLI